MGLDYTDLSPLAVCLEIVLGSGHFSAIEDVHKAMFVKLVSVKDGVVCGMNDKSDPWGLFSLRVVYEFDLDNSRLAFALVDGKNKIMGVDSWYVPNVAWAKTLKQDLIVVDPGRLVLYGGVINKFFIDCLAGNGAEVCWI